MKTKYHWTFNIADGPCNVAFGSILQDTERIWSSNWKRMAEFWSQISACKKSIAIDNVLSLL